MSDCFVWLSEKWQRWAKFFKLPQCVLRKPKHFLQSASSCIELSCWIWQQSLARPCEFLGANRSQSGALLSLSCLGSVWKVQECAALIYLLFVLFCFLYFFFLFFLCERMCLAVSWCWATAAWGVDQTLVVLLLWVIRRIELTGRARKYQGGWVCVCVCASSTQATCIMLCSHSV